MLFTPCVSRTFSFLQLRFGTYRTKPSILLSPPTPRNWLILDYSDESECTVFILLCKQCLMWPRLASSSLGGEGQPWMSDPSASVCWALGSRMCVCVCHSADFVWSWELSSRLLIHKGSILPTKLHSQLRIYLFDLLVFEAVSLYSPGCPRTG